MAISSEMARPRRDREWSDTGAYVQQGVCADTRTQTHRHTQMDHTEPRTVSGPEWEDNVAARGCHNPRTVSDMVLHMWPNANPLITRLTNGGRERVYFLSISYDLQKRVDFENENAIQWL